MASAVEQLIQKVKASGRLPESDGLVSLLSALLEQSPIRGLGSQFPRSAVKAALKTADPHSALVRMVRLLSAVDDPNFYYAWYVSLHDGMIDNSLKNWNPRIWPVRGPAQSVPPSMLWLLLLGD